MPVILEEIAKVIGFSVPTCPSAARCRISTSEEFAKATGFSASTVFRMRLS